jgi:hypothetical protein
MARICRFISKGRKRNEYMLALPDRQLGEVVRAVLGDEVGQDRSASRCQLGLDRLLEELRAATSEKPDWGRAGRSSRTLSESIIVALAASRCAFHIGPP